MTSPQELADGSVGPMDIVEAAAPAAVRQRSKQPYLPGIGVRMLRLLGDNGKPIDNMHAHAHHPALPEAP